jgi:peptidyl-prolyl cis-trans isomerase SurA
LKEEKEEEVIVAHKDVIFNSNEFTDKDSALPEDFKGKKGVSKLYESNGLFVVVKVNTIKEAAVKTFEDARGQVISDYQKELEKSWVAGLRAKHKIEVNQEALSKLEQKFE